VPAPASSGSGLTPDGRRILAAIEVSVMTVNRRHCGLQLLAATLGVLCSGREDPGRQRGPVP
jgi:hypothetical protein